MVEVEVNETIEAPVEEVWAGIRDFGDLRWGGIQKCQVEGHGLGAVRTIRVRAGLAVQERLEALDDAGHCFSYSVVEPTILPVVNCLAEVRLSADDGHTAVSWSGRFEPNGVTEEQAIRLMRGIYANGVRGMKRTFAQG